MKTVALVVVLCAAVTSQPQPRCATPKQWEGLSTLWIPEEGYFIDTVINYDFTNQKLRYFGSTTIFNDSSKPTFHFEEIYLYNENVLYTINRDTKTCQKSPPVGPFQTIDIPPTAHFVAEEWIGVKGLVGAGFETELWVGTPPGTYSYAGLVSQVGCIPIMRTLYYNYSTMYYQHATLYNVTLGIKDPSVFTPPAYCNQ